MASNDVEDFCSNTLSLTEEEMGMLPWQQMLANGALNPSCVVVSDSKNIIEENVGEPEEYFSDGELSGNEEQNVHDARTIELREYQKELAVHALQGKNTIICAPTGSGKTRVATYIISEHLKVPDSRGRKKKVAFLARTVPLAVQQYKSLCKCLPNYEDVVVMLVGILYTVKISHSVNQADGLVMCSELDNCPIIHITGESGTNMSLHMLLPDYDIVVMTPMILVNHLTRNLLPNLGVFSMLVFDECHHTRKGEPYNTLMSSYIKSKHDISEANRNGKILNITMPQIVGLTASLSVEGTCSHVVAEGNIMSVCGNLDVSVISTIENNKEELRRIVPVPAEVSKRLSRRRDDVAVYKIIEIMQNLEKHLKEHIKELNRPDLIQLARTIPDDKKSQEYEQWAVKTMMAAEAVPLSTTDRGIDLTVRLVTKIAEYLQGYRFALETYDLVELRDVVNYLDKCFWGLQAHEKRTTKENAFYEYFNELKNFVLKEHETKNPNLDVLAETLMEHIVNKGVTTRGIIFVRTRALAVALASWLNRCEIEELRNLKAHYFTGSNTPEEKGGTSLARQDSIINKFRSGSVRIIVATSVAEEGIDIPDCNLVIKYNHVGNEVSLVQTRGRSRAIGGLSVLLGMDSVLEREDLNKCSAKLMLSTIESIKKMDPADFEAVVQSNQRKFLEEILLAEAAKRAQRQRSMNVPFSIVCPKCRQVSIENTWIKTIYEKYRVSIDRNLLNKIMVLPFPDAEPMDGLFFVGKVLCKGETSPGKLCFHKLGFMIKHMGIPIVTVGIDNIAFHRGNQADLVKFKKWKRVPFAIDEMSYDDIRRYITESNVLTVTENRGNDVDDESDTTDDENID